MSELLIENNILNFIKVNIYNYSINYLYQLTIDGIYIGSYNNQSM